MKCPFCDTQIDNITTKVCPNCGKSLSEGAPSIGRPTLRKPGLSTPSLRKANAPMGETEQQIHTEQPAPVAQQSVDSAPQVQAHEQQASVPEAAIQSEASDGPAADIEDAQEKAQTTVTSVEDATASEHEPLTFSEDNPPPILEKPEKPRTPRRGQSRVAAPAQKVQQPKKQKMSKGKKWGIAAAVVALLSAAGVGTHFYVMHEYQSWSRMFKMVFNIGKAEVSPAVIEMTTGTDGLPAHTFTVKGDSPDVLLIKNLNNQQVTFMNGEATLTVPDTYFIPKEVTSDAETMSVQMDFAILDTSGNETPVPSDPFTVVVPMSTVKNAVPAEDTFETTDAALNISMEVPLQSTVLINGQDQSAAIQNNVFTLSQPLQMGANAISVEVQTPYYRPYKRTITATRVLPPVAIGFAANPPKRTEESSITYSGTVEKGAELKLESTGRLSYNKDTGAFSVKMSMSKLGLYPIKLTATMAGKNNGVLTAQVERIPNQQKYIQQSKEPDLDKLFEKPGSYRGKKYAFTGTVASMEGNTLVMTLPGERQLAFEYNGDIGFSTGDTVKVYGEIRSVENNVTNCVAWFVVK